MSRKKLPEIDPESYIIRKATQKDLIPIAHINAKVFAGSRNNVKNALSWVRSLHRGAPVYQYYVIAEKKHEDIVLGYAGWQLHGGLDRVEPVVELDQIGIAEHAQGKGLGEKLIRECIARIVPWLAKISPNCGGYVSVVVWGYADNPPAMALYKKIFIEGVCGERTQFEDKRENMFRLRVNTRT